MKRASALAPLSRDHHVALVVARQLLRADGSGAEEDLARVYTVAAGKVSVAHGYFSDDDLLSRVGIL
jgi:hypothetical protein